MGNPLRPARMAFVTTFGHEFARNLWGGKGGPMDACLKQVQMVRTFVTPLWRKPGRVPNPKASCPLGMDALLEQRKAVVRGVKFS